jgi:hypothetical protein
MLNEYIILEAALDPKSTNENFLSGKVSKLQNIGPVWNCRVIANLASFVIALTLTVKLLHNKSKNKNSFIRIAIYFVF